MDVKLSHSKASHKILIAGVGRSGTTSIYCLLQQIFEDQQQGNTEYVYEPFLWNRDTFNRPYSEIGSLFKNVESISPTGIHHHLNIPLFCESDSNMSIESRNWLSGLWNPTRQKENSVVKMIRACGRLELIRQLLPDVKIIAVFRNPLDVINSSINMFSLYGGEFHSSDYNRFVNEARQLKHGQAFSKTNNKVQRESQYWQTMVQQAITTIANNSDNVLPVLHEQFVTQREKVVRQICDFTETRFQDIYVSHSEESVGPTQSNNNNLFVEEYLHLEDQLYQYAEKMAGIFDFDITSMLNSIKEKYITTPFLIKREQNHQTYCSHYASSQLASKLKQNTKLKEKIANLESHIQELENPKTALERDWEVASLKQQLDNRGIEIQRSNQELNQLRTELSQLQIQREHREDELRHQNEEIKKELSLSNEALIESQQDLGKSEIKCAEIQSLLSQKGESSNQLVEQLQAEVSEHMSAVAGLKLQLHTANEKTEADSLSVLAANEQIEQLADMLEVRDMEFEQLSEELSNANAQLEDTRQDSLALEELRAQHQLIVGSLRENLTDERGQIQQLTSILADYEVELLENRQKVDQLHSELKLAVETRNAAEEKSQLIETQSSVQEQTLNEQQKCHIIAIDSLRADLQIQNQKLNQYEHILSQLRKLSDYPISQIDRKARAYRKLIRTYNRVKPSWHKLKAPNYSSRHKNKLRAKVRSHGVDLGNQISAFYGNHRSGWAFAVNSLADLHTPDSVYLDTFIERSFCWSPEGVKPHLRPWIGFIHVPPFVPAWFQYDQSNQAIFKTSAWQESLPHCRGLFTLSKYHRDYLQPKFDFPVDHLVHPTEFPDRLWDWHEFEANRNKRIVQLGWWLRKLHAIHQLPETSYQKTMLRPSEQDYLKQLFNKEKQQLMANGELHESMYDSVEVLKFLPNDQYDQLLSNNIVFLNLYDSSANNSVIECIARGTPLLVNRIAPVEEYLGPDYPLYYDTLSEAANKVMDFGLIRETHEYLMECETRKKLTGEYFQQSLLESDVLLNVYQDFKSVQRAA